MTSADVLAIFDEDGEPVILARRRYYLPSPNRDGTDGGRVHAGGIVIHQPVVAILLPEDFPPLSRRRPDFAGLRHVLVRFSFMLDRLPPRHAYDSATVTVVLDHPGAVVLAQRPSLVTTESESSGSTTTEMSAALEGLARLGAQRTKTVQTTRRTSLPLITAENRGPGGFGWHYQAQDGAPLLSHVESSRALIELPKGLTELSGTINSEAIVSFFRYGVFTRSKAMSPPPPVQFRLSLGTAG